MYLCNSIYLPPSFCVEDCLASPRIRDPGDNNALRIKDSFTGNFVPCFIEIKTESNDPCLNHISKRKEFWKKGKK